MDFAPVIDFVENVLRREKGIPGCDLQIMQDHTVLFRYSSGASDYEGNTPVSRDDLYFLYSCTKPMTCAAAMQLVEQGKISLDAPVGDYLPAYKAVFLLKDGKKVPPQNTMTVRHLFTMSAGLDYKKKKGPILAVLEKNPHAGTLELVNSFARSPLNFEPGEKFLYSLCHDVLAAIVEVVSGMRFSEYMKEHIWEPLGMTRTGFHVSEEAWSHMAAQYDYREGEGIVSVPMTNTFRLSDTYESGGAGLISCTDDYSLFADAMACGGVGKTGARILKPETIDLMRSEQLKNYAMNGEFSCAAGPGYGYGLGVRTLVDRSQGQRSALGEFGWDGAAGSYVLMDPAHKLSIFFAMHVRTWPKLIGQSHSTIRDLTYEVLRL